MVFKCHLEQIPKLPCREVFVTQQTACFFAGNSGIAVTVLAEAVILEHDCALPDGAWVLLAQTIGEAESSDLENRLIGRPEAKRLDAGSLGHAAGGRSSSRCSGGGFVEGDDETILLALPAEDVSSGSESDVCDGDG